MSPDLTAPGIPGPDLTAQPPTAVFTRVVRVAVVLYAVGLVVMGAWDPIAGAPVPLFAVVLDLVSATLIVAGTVQLWRWAGRPRLTSAQQRTVAEAVRGADRTAMSRAIRRGGPPPPHLKPWALPWAQVQQRSVPLGCFLLLATASALLTVATEPKIDVFGWMQLGIAAVTGTVSVGVVFWAHRALTAATSPTAGGLSSRSGPSPSRFPPGATPPTVAWRDGEPRFDSQRPHPDGVDERSAT